MIEPRWVQRPRHCIAPYGTKGVGWPCREATGELAYDAKLRFYLDSVPSRRAGTSLVVMQNLRFVVAGYDSSHEECVHATIQILEFFEVGIGGSTGTDFHWQGVEPYGQQCSKCCRMTVHVDASLVLAHIRSTDLNEYGGRPFSGGTVGSDRRDYRGYTYDGRITHRDGRVAVMRPGAEYDSTGVNVDVDWSYGVTRYHYKVNIAHCGAEDANQGQSRPPVVDCLVAQSGIYQPPPEASKRGTISLPAPGGPPFGVPPVESAPHPPGGYPEIQTIASLGDSPRSGSFVGSALVGRGDPGAWLRTRIQRRKSNEDRRDRHPPRL